MSGPQIRVQNVTKIFHKHQRKRHFLTVKSTFIRDIWRKREDKSDLFHALQDVSFDIEPGETFGIIGSNGSGKSTLLKLLAGILKPTSGSVEVRGRLSALIELGAGFHPEISGRENVFINGIMLGLSRNEIAQKFDEIVRFAELGEFIDNPVRTYSSGMFMRLGFSVATHVNPDVLLIDEVLAVGDQSFIHKCLERIFEFKRRKKTIIIVSHDLSAVEKLCTRVAWIAHGELKMIGAAREVIDSYLMAVAKKEEERFATQHQVVMESLDSLHHASNGTNPVSTADPPDNATSDAKKRWGTRDVEITAVKVLDANDTERYVFKTGEDVVFRFEYSAHKRIEKPVFGIGFFLEDGTWCYGTNTHLENFQIEEIEGEGWVAIRFNSMNFIQNSYLVDVAVHAVDGTPYDYHSRLYKIAFRSEIRDSGIVRLPHQWSFSPELDVTEL